MKTDIPARLRRYARWDNIKTPAGDALLLEAAAEIERLENIIMRTPHNDSANATEQESNGPRRLFPKPV